MKIFPNIVNHGRIFIFLILLCSFSPSFPQIVLNEFLASNTQTNFDPQFTEYADWIELYNTGQDPVNLIGYYLTDDLAFPTKWRINFDVWIAPGGYRLFWANGKGFGNYTNFSLSSDMEEIGLVDMSGFLIDSISYPPQNADISYGRSPDNLEEWGFFYHPTPSSGNDQTFLPELFFAESPSFSIQGGIYQNPGEVNISAISPNAIIRYTLDGTIPGENSNLYNEPISMTDTVTIVRARVFESGFAPGNIISHTYICNRTFDLPVVCVTTDPDNLWNDTIGIYCFGTNGILGHDGFVANYWHTNWERPANVEIYESNGEQVINQIAGIALNGAKRNMGQKSLRLFARNKYGINKFNYRFFQDRENSSFSSLILRNGGYPDFSSSMIRDGLGQSLTIDKMKLDYQSYRQAVLYLNGVYWGIYNIREKQNEDYLAANDGVDPNNINLLEGENGFPIEGSNEDYILIRDFIDSNDINTTENYSYVESKVDIDNYIDYQTTEIYLGNYDWPMINIKFWEKNNNNGKWKWILFDIDACFGLWGTYYKSFINHATATEGTGWPNPPNSTLFFRNMLNANKFRDRFVQRYAAHINTTFAPERINFYADSLKSNIASEIPEHINRWKDNVCIDGTCVQTISEWEETFNVIQEFANNRPGSTRENFMNKFNISGVYELSTEAMNGHIEINNVPMPSGIFTGIYFKSVPIQLTAIPDLGYKFAGWSGASISTSPEIELTLSNTKHIKAWFELSDNTVLPEFFTIDDTLYTVLSPYMGMGDININAGVSVYIEPDVEILMPESCCINVYGQLIVNGTENDPVAIKANKEVGTNKWGALCFYNSTDSCLINNLLISDASIGRIDTLQIGAISSFNSKLFISGTNIDNSSQPFYAEFGEIQIINSFFRSNKTCDLINIKYADFALVEHCNLRGNEAPDTDAIDYDHISEGIIRNNIIYGFFGFNSDGIDIGEQAQDILIENNQIFNCNDKGISVGQASSAIIRRNVIFNCNLGVGVKDSLAFAYIDQNTFYNNNYAIACFEKNYNSGGGSALVKNSILANSKKHSYLKDEKSQLEISYSLSNTDLLSGTSNLFLDPLFVDTLIMNFELQNSSPCINSGDPLSPHDPDGSNADMGAYFSFVSPIETNRIVINEINYHSDSLIDSGDWVELYNNSSTDIDLSGWILMDGKDDNRYNLPYGIMLKTNGYLVICNDKMKFCNVNHEVVNFVGNIPFLFDNNGEPIRLFDAEMNLIDLVEFDDKNPWPEEPDGEGPTLQLIDPDSDNNIPSNWVASDSVGGSPGKHFLSDTNEYILSEFCIYPNPASHYFYIQSDKISKEPMTVEIYNICGQMKEHKNYTGMESEIRIDCSFFKQGLYLIRITQNETIFNGKIIIQKN